MGVRIGFRVPCQPLYSLLPGCRISGSSRHLGASVFEARLFLYSNPWTPRDGDSAGVKTSCGITECSRYFLTGQSKHGSRQCGTDSKVYGRSRFECVHSFEQYTIGYIIIISSIAPSYAYPILAGLITPQLHSSCPIRPEHNHCKTYKDKGHVSIRT